MIAVLIILNGVGVPTITFAQQNAEAQKFERANAAPASNSKSLPSAASVSNEKLSNELALVKEQNRLVREYHSSLLATVYWALTGLFTLAALLAGFGWWSNFKLYERDKETLENKFESKLKQIEAAAAARMQERMLELSENVDRKNDALADRVSKELLNLRTELATERQFLIQQLTELRGQVEHVRTKQSKISKQLSVENATLREVEEHIWGLKGIPENILITQSQALRSAAKAEAHDLITTVLLRMGSTLEQHFINPGVKCEDDIIDILNSALDEVADTHGVEVARLKGLLARLSD